MAAALLFPAVLAAHGVEVSFGAEAFGSEAVRFMYSTGEEMSFALVRVFAPSRPDTETLQSLTDRNGYYAFVPDEEGEWRITAEDDMGHKGEIKTTVAAVGTGAAPGGSAAASGGRGPVVLRVILGLSLILNIFAAYGFALGRKGGKHAH
jgi:nickel transport protein